MPAKDLRAVLPDLASDISVKPLMDALAAVGPAPCDGCPMRQACAWSLLACSAFHTFVSGKGDWQEETRGDADERRYDKVFKGDRKARAKLRKARAAQLAPTLAQLAGKPARKAKPAKRAPFTVPLVDRVKQCQVWG